MPRQQLTNLDFNNQAKAVNLTNPTAAQDAATKAYVDSAVEGLAWKDSARVSTGSNVNLSAPGATLDGVTMAANDRFLARAQTTTSQNGIYIFNGAATPATRSLDANSYDELESAVITVDEGTSAGTTYRQTGVNGTIDSTAVTWTTFGTAAPAATETTAGVVELATQAETDTGTDDTRAITPLKLANQAGRFRRFASTIGDGSATQYTVTHNLNTQDVTVAVFRASGAFDEVGVDVERTTVNSITVRFASPPAAASFRVVVHA